MNIRILRKYLSPILATLFLVGVLAMPLTACSPNDGVAEEIGEDIDEAVDEVEDEVDDATDSR